MPTESLSRNERVTSEAVPEVMRSREEDALRTFAVQHLERVRKFKLYPTAYVLSMLVLTPVWIVTQYERRMAGPSI